jgi:clan AA aspartic protease
MILGTVDSRRTPLVPLVLRPANGDDLEVEAVVDTGFNGSLTLPAETIRRLGFEWRGRSSVTLANGAVEWCDVFRAAVIWENTPRSVLAESAETEPLIGMRLLDGCRLSMYVIPGGEVRIETNSESKQ